MALSEKRLAEIRELLSSTEIPNDVLLHRRAVRDLMAAYDVPATGRSGSEPMSELSPEMAEHVGAGATILGCAMARLCKQLQEATKQHETARDGWAATLDENALLRCRAELAEVRAEAVAAERDNVLQMHQRIREFNPVPVEVARATLLRFAASQERRGYGGGAAVRDAIDAIAMHNSQLRSELDEFRLALKSLTEHSEAHEKQLRADRDAVRVEADRWHARADEMTGRLLNITLSDEVVKEQERTRQEKIRADKAESDAEVARAEVKRLQSEPFSGDEHIPAFHS